MLKKVSLFSVIIFLTCCNANRTPIPDVPVRLEFSITAVAPELFSFNGFKEFTIPQNVSQYLGYGGILVIHNIDDKYFAFDMCCPYEVRPDVRVHCNGAGIAVCDSCQSSFYVGDGNGFPTAGKAKYPLKRYSVYYDSTTAKILVTN